MNQATPDLPPGMFSFGLVLGDDPNGPASASFQEATGLHVAPGEYSDENVPDALRRIPKATTAGNLVLRRGMVSIDSPLGTWCRETLGSQPGTPIRARDLELRLQDANGAVLVRWNFTAAWPVKWSVAAQIDLPGKLVVETLEFAYQSFVRR